MFVRRGRSFKRRAICKYFTVSCSLTTIARTWVSLLFHRYDTILPVYHENKAGGVHLKNLSTYWVSDKEKSAKAGDL